MRFLGQPENVPVLRGVWRGRSQVSLLGHEEENGGSCYQSCRGKNRQRICGSSRRNNGGGRVQYEVYVILLLLPQPHLLCLQKVVVLLLLSRSPLLDASVRGGLPGIGILWLRLCLRLLFRRVSTHAVYLPANALLDASTQKGRHRSSHTSDMATPPHGRSYSHSRSYHSRVPLLQRFLSSLGRRRRKARRVRQFGDCQSARTDIEERTPRFGVALGGRLQQRDQCYGLQQHLQSSHAGRIIDWL